MSDINRIFRFYKEIIDIGKKNKNVNMKIKESNPNAWIVSSNDRGRKSIKKDKVYLFDNEKFEIELYNPLRKSVLADIKLNGKSISKTGLIIKPGQRIYLDCFIDNKRKFIFKTYNVDDTEESKDSIKLNGNLEVFFYEEEVIDFNKINYIPYNNPFNPYTIPYTDPYPTYPKIWYSLNSNSNFDYSCKSIETGRIEKGDISNQKFEEIYMDFKKNYISHTILKLLPDSLKPKEIIKSKKENDIYSSIRKLHELYKDDILTESEYLKKKEELLNKI
jgi:hypothetical protein